ncbi:MAG: hypothetical protein IKE22_02590 [Atopobiaceae bacterium]|nr:hypothetical protein [Atopobiaceae bacterium]
MKWIGGCLKIVGAVVVALVVLGLVFGGSGSKSDSGKTDTAETKQEQTEEAAKQEEAAPEPEPVSYQDVDINTLFETLSSNPLNAKNTYEGTPVRFTGVLKNIDASGKYFSLGNGDDYSFERIQCYIKNDDTLNAIASASMGDSITVCGTISSVGEVLGYSMDVDYIE